MQKPNGFEYGNECPQKECNDTCIYSKECAAISQLVDAGHTPKCACNLLFEQANCGCGKVNQL